MMTIGSAQGANGSMQSGGSNVQMQSDPVSKSIQKQIADAQKQLQELSSNKDMPQEEKMKRRQEIQQEICSLNQQLRQHQIEQRKEQQRKASAEDGNGSRTSKAKEKEQEGNGLSQTGMQAMLSADASMKQAKVQNRTALQMNGRAGVLEAEMKLDSGRGSGAERKKEELADVQQKAQEATASQMSTLARANEVMEKAAEEDRREEDTADEESLKGQDSREDEAASGRQSIDVRI